MTDMEKGHTLEAYDNDYGLDEIFKSAGLNSLQKILAGLLGNEFSITDTAGTLILGVESDYSHSMNIDIEFETIGRLNYDSDINKDTLSAIDNTIKMISAAYQKYIMASSLHIEAIHSDYAEIMEKNRLLEESEAKYRLLSEQLDTRVKEQVLDIESKQKQLYQAERYSAIGRLAAGVAHEINNPMGFILSNLNTSKHYVENLTALSSLFEAGKSDDIIEFWKSSELNYDIEDFVDLIDESIQGSERIKSIVSALMIFSDADIDNAEMVSIKALLTSVIDRLLIPDHKSIKLDLDIQADANINCNAVLLSQVLLNIISNAINSIESDGVITISDKLVENDFVISVKDTGAGIDEKIMSKIFDPFFTTSEVGEGVGLGLTVVKEVMASTGGRVDIRSVQGRGTEVTLSIPVN